MIALFVVKPQVLPQTGFRILYRFAALHPLRLCGQTLQGAYAYRRQGGEDAWIKDKEKAAGAELTAHGTGEVGGKKKMQTPDCFREEW